VSDRVISWKSVKKTSSLRAIGLLAVDLLEFYVWRILVIWISFMRRRILGYFGACLVFRLCLSYKMHWAGALVGFDVRRRRCHGDMI